MIKPHVRVKFPWRLTIGAHSWIGEEVWIDNLADVSIGAHCCISQGAYLFVPAAMTGGRDVRPRDEAICICDGAWICAQARVAPGVTIGQSAVVALGSTATRDLSPFAIHVGRPVRPKSFRRRAPRNPPLRKKQRR